MEYRNNINQNNIKHFKKNIIYILLSINPGIFLITIKQNSLYKKGVVKKEVCYALDNKKLSE